MSKNLVKLSSFKEVVKLNQKTNKNVITLAQALTDVRSELTTKNPDKEWCINKICIALNKVEKTPNKE